MRVSLFMPTWNAGTLLDAVLDGIDRQPGAAELERVAIDSGSSDDTVDRLERRGFTVHHIAQEDFNHGATRDAGIEKTSGDVIVLLTQDAIPADDHWLTRLVATYEDPRVGAAYCRQIPRDDCNPLIRKRILEWTASRPEKVLQILPGDATAAFDSLEPMQRLQTCAYDNVAGSVRRTSWEPIRFGHRRFGEDVAFGKQLILAGQAIAYEPGSAVVHSHNRSPKAEGKRIFCDHENLYDLFGVHVLPTYEHYMNAVRHGTAEFRQILAEMELGDEDRARLTDWADRYAKWSALGIYLGGNAHRFRDGLHGSWFGMVERHLREGI